MDNTLVSRGGRPVGRTGDKALNGRRLARSIIESDWYFPLVEARLKAGTLPPALEALLWHYAFGSPKHIVDMTMTVEGRAAELRGLSREELEAKAEQIVHDLRVMREHERAQKSLPATDTPPDAIDADVEPSPDDESEPTVN